MNYQPNNYQHFLLNGVMILLAIMFSGETVHSRDFTALNSSSLASIAINKSSSKATCDFSKPVNLRPTTEYGIFGNDEFDTVVCGYVVTRQIDIYEEQHKNAFLRIVAFADAGFKNSITQGVHQGNLINFIEEGIYYFNLGCWHQGKIVGDENKDEIYIDNKTQAALIKSSLNQPVTVILSFNKHPGRDCCCLNLAEKIRIY